MYDKFEFYGAPDMDQEMRGDLDEGRKGVPRVGTRVKFQPNPASMMMYSADHRKKLPDKGGEGTVTTVSVPGGKKHFMPGPGGGLVYVKWDQTGTIGVSPLDIVKVSGGKRESEGFDWGAKLDEARSTPVKGGKYKYKGKVGVWRTLPNGDRVFFPDDKSGPMAMRGASETKGKPSGAERLWRELRSKRGKRKAEDVEQEIARLEATSSPFPEVRARRIEELKAELEEERIGVPYKLGFAGPGKFKMGRGEAGHTVQHFSSPEKALEFLKSLPREARTRSYDRQLSQLEKAVKEEAELDEAVKEMERTFKIKGVSVEGGQRGYIVSIKTQDGKKIDVKVAHDKGGKAIDAAYQDASATANSIKRGRFVGRYNGRQFHVSGSTLTVTESLGG